MEISAGRPCYLPQEELGPESPGKQPETSSLPQPSQAKILLLQTPVLLATDLCLLLPGKSGCIVSWLSGFKNIVFVSWFSGFKNYFLT